MKCKTKCIISCHTGHLHWTVQQLHDMDWKYNALVGYININMIHKMDISAQDGHPVRCSYIPFVVLQLQPYIYGTIYPIYKVRWTWQIFQMHCSPLVGYLSVARSEGGAASACNGANTSLKGRKIMLMLETQWHQLDQSSNFIEKLLIFEVLSSLWQMTSATLVPPLVSKKPWCIGIYSSTALLAKFKPDKSTQVQMGQVQTTNFSLDLSKG